MVDAAMIDENIVECAPLCAVVGFGMVRRTAHHGALA
jgi:hypothetical protein